MSRTFATWMTSGDVDSKFVQGLVSFPVGPVSGGNQVISEMLAYFVPNYIDFKLIAPTGAATFR